MKVGSKANTPYFTVQQGLLATYLISVPFGVYVGIVLRLDACWFVYVPWNIVARAFDSVSSTLFPPTLQCLMFFNSLGAHMGGAQGAPQGVEDVGSSSA